MEAYKFETTVQENGVIQIPEIARLAHQEIEVFIVVKPNPQPEPDRVSAVDNFLRKWKGIIKETDPDELKSQYLQEKHG